MRPGIATKLLLLIVFLVCLASLPASAQIDISQISGSTCASNGVLQWSGTAWSCTSTGGVVTGLTSNGGLAYAGSAPNTIGLEQCSSPVGQVLVSTNTSGVATWGCSQTVLGLKNGSNTVSLSGSGGTNSITLQSSGITILDSNSSPNLNKIQTTTSGLTISDVNTNFLTMSSTQFGLGFDGPCVGCGGLTFANHTGTNSAVILSDNNANSLFLGSGPTSPALNVNFLLGNSGLVNALSNATGSSTTFLYGTTVTIGANSGSAPNSGISTGLSLNGGTATFSGTASTASQIVLGYGTAQAAPGTGIGVGLMAGTSGTAYNFIFPSAPGTAGQYLNAASATGSSTTLQWVTSTASIAFPQAVGGNTATSGGVVCATSSSSLTTSTLLANNGIVVGGGTGACPNTVANATITTAGGTTLNLGLTGGTIGRVFLSGSTSGVASLGAATDGSLSIATTGAGITLQNATAMAASTSFTISGSGANGLLLTGIEAGSGTNCLQINTSGQVSNTGSACGGSGSSVLSSITGSNAASVAITETAAGNSITFAGVETSALTFPYVYSNLNAGTATTGALLVGTTGAGANQIPFVINEGSSDTGDFLRMYAGGTVSATGGLSGGTLKFEVSSTGAVTTGVWSGTGISIGEGGLSSSSTSAAAGQVPNTTSTTVSGWTATPTLGITSTTSGVLKFASSSGGTLSLEPVTGTALGTVTMLIPIPAASPGTLTQTVANSSVTSGTVTLDTASIASGACQAVTAGSVNSIAATNVTTADVIFWTPNASIKAQSGFTPGTSGGLSIAAYPTAGFVNFDVCNWTSTSQTPGTVVLNWSVVR